MRFNDTLKKYGKQLSEYQASHSRMPSFLASSGLNKALIEEMFAPENVDLNDPAWKTGDYRHVQFISVLKKYIHNKQPSGLKISYSEYQSHQEWKKDVPLFEINITGANTELQNKLKLKKNGSVTTLSIYPQDIILVKDFIEKKQKAREQEVKKVKNKFREKNGVEPIPRTAEEIASDTFASFKQGGVSVFKGTKETAGFIGTKVADGFKNTYNLSDANSTYTSAKQELAKAEKLENRAYYFQEITQQIIEKQDEAVARRLPIPERNGVLNTIRGTQRENLVRYLNEIKTKLETLTNRPFETDRIIEKLTEISKKLDSDLFKWGSNQQLEIEEIVKMKRSLDDLVAGLKRPDDIASFCETFHEDAELNPAINIDVKRAPQYARYHLDYLLLTYPDRYQAFQDRDDVKLLHKGSKNYIDSEEWAQELYETVKKSTKEKKQSFTRAETELNNLKNDQGHYAAKGVTGTVSYTLKGGRSMASVVFSGSKVAYKKAYTFKNESEVANKFHQAETAVEKAKETILDLAALTQPEDKEIMNDLFKKIANFDKEGLDLISKSLTGDAEISSTIPKSGGAVDIRDEDSEIGTSVTKKVSTELVKFALGKDIVEPVKKYIAAQQEFKQAEAEKQYFAEFYPYTQAFSHSVRSAPRAVMNKPGAIVSSVLGGAGSKGRAENYQSEETPDAAALPPDAVAREVANRLLITLSEQITKRGATWDNGNVRPLQEFIHFAHNEDFDAATISEFLVTRMDKDSGGAKKVGDQILLLELAVLSLENNHPALAITRNNVFLQSLQGDEVVKEFLTTYIDQEIRAHLLESKQIRRRSAADASLHHDSDNSHASENSDYVSYSTTYGNTAEGNTTQTNTNKSFFSFRRVVGGGGSSHSSDGNSGFNTMFKPRAYSFTNSQEDKKALKKWNATHRKVNRTVESKGGLQPGDKLATGLEVGVVNFSGMGLDKLISHVEDMIANYDEQDENYRQALTQERHEFLVAQAKEVVQIHTNNSMNDTEKSEQLTKVIGKIDKVTLSKDEAEARKIYNNVVSCFNAIKNHYSLVVEHKGESEPSHDARTASKVGDAAKFPRSLSFSERIENDKNNTPEIKRSNSR